MKIKLIIFIFLTLVLLASVKAAFFYHAHYTDARNQLRQQQEQVNTLQQRLNTAAAMDKKYVSQLQQARENAGQLEHDVATGKRRLQLAASCNRPVKARPVGMADAASPRLNDAAQRNYFTLRERIATARIQITGLQDYIHQQCQL